jgi:hypothetical protein
MRVRLALISLDDLARVRPLVDALRNAVNAGNMDDTDSVTEKLMSMMAKERSIDLSEAEWRRFLAELRAENPAFQSDYLLPSEVCSEIFPNAALETMVLQLPFDEEVGDDV